jgi:Thioredoxin
MSTPSSLQTPIHAYVEVDEGYYALYEAYSPDFAPLMRTNMALPECHVVVASRRTCPDCLRNVSRMARIAEYLPGWTWDIYASDDQPERSSLLDIVAVPTFIVYDHAGGRELGRIIEIPAHESLEQDLLAIAQSAK